LKRGQGKDGGKGERKTEWEGEALRAWAREGARASEDTYGASKRKGDGRGSKRDASMFY
jgi:hypothetical protein